MRRAIRLLVSVCSGLLLASAAAVTLLWVWSYFRGDVVRYVTPADGGIRRTYFLASTTGRLIAGRHSEVAPPVPVDVAARAARTSGFFFDQWDNMLNPFHPPRGRALEPLIVGARVERVPDRISNTVAAPHFAVALALVLARAVLSALARPRQRAAGACATCGAALAVRGRRVGLRHVALALFGLTVLVVAVRHWQATGFGTRDPESDAGGRFGVIGLGIAGVLLAWSIGAWLMHALTSSRAAQARAAAALDDPSRCPTCGAARQEAAPALTETSGA